MKVLLGHCFYRSTSPSGEDSVYKSEKSMLESFGVEVIPWEKFNDHVNVSGFFSSVKTALYTTWSYSSYAEAVYLIDKYKPDVVHFHNTFPQFSPSVYKACYDCNVPVVQTLHNYRNICPGAMLLRDGKPCELCLNNSLMPMFSLRYKCYRDSIAATLPLALMIARNRINESYNKYVSRYIVLTQFAIDRFVRGGFPEDKILVKPNFLSIKDGVNSLIVDETYAVFVGRLSDEKGIRTLIKTWMSGVNIKLYVVGSGPLKSELEDFVFKNKLNVEFLGFRSQEDVLSIVKNAMMQIIPSECYEGFPMSILEAFSCGTPVIASRLGSLQEIVTDNKTGVLFEPGNSIDLLAKVNDLISDPNKRVVLSANGRKEFNAKYTKEINFKELVGIYNKSIDEFRKMERH